MTKEDEVKKLIKEINQQVDSLKIEMAKATEIRIRKASFNCSALHRTRKLLLKLEKLGFEFRKASVAYQKELKSE